MMADPVFLTFARRTMEKEVQPGLPVVAGLDHAAYVAQSIRRLTNTALQHRTAQIATDGSRKIRQRLLEALQDALLAGRESSGIEIEVAGWIEHVTRFARQDMGITDPVVPVVQAILDRTGNVTEPTVMAILALDAVFPAALTEQPGLRDRLVTLVEAIRIRGPIAVMAAHLETT
jgi:fructuronate reductase